MWALSCKLEYNILWAWSVHKLSILLSSLLDPKLKLLFWKNNTMSTYHGRCRVEWLRCHWQQLFVMAVLDSDSWCVWPERCYGRPRSLSWTKPQPLWIWRRMIWSKPRYVQSSRSVLCSRSPIDSTPSWTMIGEWCTSEVGSHSWQQSQVFFVFVTYYDLKLSFQSFFLICNFLTIYENINIKKIHFSKIEIFFPNLPAKGTLIRVLDNYLYKKKTFPEDQLVLLSFSLNNVLSCHPVFSESWFWMLERSESTRILRSFCRTPTLYFTEWLKMQVWYYEEAECLSVCPTGSQRCQKSSSSVRRRKMLNRCFRSGARLPSGQARAM